MIIVLSIPDDISTTDVIEWLNALGGKYIRFDDTELIKQEFEISIKANSYSIKYLNSEIENSGKNAFWFRRSSLENVLPDLSFISDVEFVKSINSHSLNEVKETFSLIFNLFKNENWLSNPLNVRLNKSKVLHLASTFGIRIPKTCITNSLRALKKFKEKYGVIIAKNIHELVIFRQQGKEYPFASYTELVTEDFIRKLPDIFIPCLFQEAVEKEYEIRTFFIENKCYSMAIFSQGNEQTSVDFRRYDNEIPNRVVPYKLPAQIESQLGRLMAALGLNSGSVDWIKAKNGDMVFLEINPVGQFGMVSYPCNYYIEKEIAETLIKMENNAN